MLVYPVGKQPVDLCFSIDGYQIRIYALNLAQSWKAIATD